MYLKGSSEGKGQTGAAISQDNISSPVPAFQSLKSYQEYLTSTKTLRHGPRSLESKISRNSSFIYPVVKFLKEKEVFNCIRVGQERVHTS